MFRSKSSSSRHAQFLSTVKPKQNGYSIMKILTEFYVQRGDKPPITDVPELIPPGFKVNNIAVSIPKDVQCGTIWDFLPALSIIDNGKGHPPTLSVKWKPRIELQYILYKSINTDHMPIRDFVHIAQQAPRQIHLEEIIRGVNELKNHVAKLCDPQRQQNPKYDAVCQHYQVILDPIRDEIEQLAMKIGRLKDEQRLIEDEKASKLAELL